MTTLKDLTQFGFKEEELEPVAGDLTGKTLVLRPDRIKPKYRNRGCLTWEVMGGFGCSPTSLGRGVFATCVADKEECKWMRSDFIAILKD